MRACGVPVHRSRQREYDIWQGHFWESLVPNHTNDTDFTGYADHTHFNSAKDDLAWRPLDWRWPSLHRYIRQGIVPTNSAVGVDQEQFGK